MLGFLRSRSALELRTSPGWESGELAPPVLPSREALEDASHVLCRVLQRGEEHVLGLWDVGVDLLPPGSFLTYPGVHRVVCSVEMADH